jgi:hypothetical protein
MMLSSYDTIVMRVHAHSRKRSDTPPTFVRWGGYSRFHMHANLTTHRYFRSSTAQLLLPHTSAHRKCSLMSTDRCIRTTNAHYVLHYSTYVLRMLTSVYTTYYVLITLRESAYGNLTSDYLMYAYVYTMFPYSVHVRRARVRPPVADFITILRKTALDSICRIFTLGLLARRAD